MHHPGPLNVLPIKLIAHLGLEIQPPMMNEAASAAALNGENRMKNRFGSGDIFWRRVPKSKLYGSVFRLTNGSFSSFETNLQETVKNRKQNNCVE
jgi:hypothetical protein